MTEVPPALRGLVRETPLVASPLGLLKLESLQRTGSFKLRGATRALAQLAARGVRAVVTASAGNHGLGVACAGAALGMRVLVVVPENAARKKRDGILGYGAELQIAGAGYDAAEGIARARAVELDAPFVSPFDDDEVIAGNGRWLAEELLAQRPSLRRVVAPVGGGGLIGGLLLELSRRVEVLGVQPSGATAMARSLARGEAVLDDDGTTICSGLDGGVAERTFAIARGHGLRIVEVDEASVLPAIAYAYRGLGQTIEPAAAVVIAAALAGRFDLEETALVVSGGNLDADILDAALA